MSAAQEKPSLHDIAAMPYPRSVEAMRKHYNPQWGKGKDGELQTWKVRLEYSYRTDDVWTCEVQAVDEDDAIRIAEDEFDNKCSDASADDCKIDNATAKVAA